MYVKPSAVFSTILKMHLTSISCVFAFPFLCR